MWKRESPQINGVFIRGMQLAVNQVTVAAHILVCSVTHTQTDTHRNVWFLYTNVYLQCLFYRVPELIVCVLGDIPWRLPCVGTR